MMQPISLKPPMMRPSQSKEHAERIEKKAMFEAYDAVDAEVQEAKRIYEAALARRSAQVEQICDAFGKGPFNFRGGVTIVERGTTFFFRGINKKALEDV